MNSKYITGEVSIIVGTLPPRGITKNVLWQRPTKANPKVFELCY